MYVCVRIMRKTEDTFTKPVQDGDIAPLSRPTVLSKRYKGGMASEPAAGASQQN